MMSDLINRAAVIDALEMLLEQQEDDEHDKIWNNAIRGSINVVKHHVSSAQPENCLDEWCTDCKEYDQEKYCCPRFNRVIRKTLQEVQAKRKRGKWINVNDDGSLWRCDQCKDTACCRGNYCPNCGADMRGEEDV